MITGPTLYGFRYKVRCWSKIANFSYPFRPGENGCEYFRANWPARSPGGVNGFWKVRCLCTVHTTRALQTDRRADGRTDRHTEEEKSDLSNGRSFYYVTFAKIRGKISIREIPGNSRWESGDERCSIPGNSRAEIPDGFGTSSERQLF